MFSFPHVHPDTWSIHLFEKLTPETGGWIWETPVICTLWHTISYFFNTFSDDLHFDGLIIGLC